MTQSRPARSLNSRFSVQLPEVAPAQLPNPLLQPLMQGTCCDISCFSSSWWWVQKCGSLVPWPNGPEMGAVRPCLREAWVWQPCCGRRGSKREHFEQLKDSRDSRASLVACHPGESGSDGSSTLPRGMHGREQARSTQVSRQESGHRSDNSKPLNLWQPRATSKRIQHISKHIETYRNISYTDCRWL